MHIFLCPDKFKGSATANEVIEAMKSGILSSLPEATISASAISDGGDGFAQIASESMEGQWIVVDSQDALHRPITATYYIADNVAYIDMSITNGLAQISNADRDPMNSSTFGTGMLIKHAATVNKVHRIVIGLGGSATNDGGAGMAAALGVRFLDHAENELSPIPHELLHCARIDTSGIISLPPITAACDVNNPLLGENGATAIYGPQKGVIAIADAEAILTHLMHIGDGVKHAEVAGSGAAGGIAYGLLHYAGASLESGFSIVSNIIKLEQKIQSADIVVTGEGSLDSQTLNGKGPHGVALLANKHSKKVYAIAGVADASVEPFFSGIETLASIGLPLENCIADAKNLIKQQSNKLAKQFI